VIDLLTLRRRGLGWGPVRRARAARELGRLVRTLARSSLFDRQLYEAQRQRSFASAETAAYDYVVVGSRLGLVAGPLLIPPVSAQGRPTGPGAAAWWASQVRAAGFPRTTAHPLADLRWYAATVPEAESWRGGPLAHYTEKGRHAGARLGPLDPGVDLVQRGSEVVSSTRPGPESAPDTGAQAVDLEGPVAALVIAAQARGALDVLPVLLDPLSGLDRIVVVTRPGGTPESRVALAAVALLAPRVHVLSAVAPDRTMVQLVTASTAEVVLVMTTPLELSTRTLRSLIATVRDGADVAQPVVLASDDTVLAAGVDAQGARRWRGWPLSDAERDADVSVPAVSGELAALRPSAVPTFVASGNGDAAERLTSLSAAVTANGGRVLVCGGVHARVVPSRAATSTASAGSTPAPRPYADPAMPGVLRWAIKSPHPAGARRSAWGDYHVARALAAELEVLGHHTAVDPVESWYRETASADDVTLTLRGLRRFRPSAHQVNLLWVLSHPELVEGDERADFDVVLAASRSWAQRMSRPGALVVPMLQCTDARAFRPDVAEPGGGPDLLFVGNSRSASRPLVEAAARTRSELTVIGGGWAGRLPDGVLRADHVENTDLPELYRGAGVVLNDHWPHMAAEGFLSNRLFDLTAAGARWVSDAAQDLLEVFPTGRVARDADELGQLLDGFPGTFPTEGELQEASRRIRELHSFEARARELSELVTELVAQRAV
jgi:hypothetical protein